jgi:hypothetical protein
MNEPKYQLNNCKATRTHHKTRSPSILRPAKIAANNATLNLLLPFIQDNSAIKISSLLLLRDLERPAIMTATNVIFSLQLIVELLLTGTKQVAPITILDDSFKLIDVLASEGATFAPHISEDAFDCASKARTTSPRKAQTTSPSKAPSASKSESQTASPSNAFSSGKFTMVPTASPSNAPTSEPVTATSSTKPTTTTHHPTKQPSCEPIHEPTKRMDLNAVLSNNLSQINNAVLTNHSKQWISFADQPSIDEEINNPTAASDSSKNQWHMPTPINLESSGLCRSSRTEVLARRGLVYSHTTLMDQDEGMTKPQNAHLLSASQQSFSSVRVPFSTICPFGGSSCWVQSLAVKVQASSTPTVSRHAFALFAFEPVTSTKQISLPTALNATAEMQPSADISQDPGPLAEQPIAVTDSSKSQLIVKSKSEGAREAPNHSSQLSVASINSEISFHFCDNCRIFREGEWEIEVNGELKVDGHNELTEPDKMVDGVIQYSDNDQVDDQVLTEESTSIDGHRVEQRSRVDERPRIDETSSLKIETACCLQTDQTKLHSDCSVLWSGTVGQRSSVVRRWRYFTVVMVKIPFWYEVHM